MAALFTSNDAGCTLAERLNSGGEISVDTAMTLVQTLAEAVQQIHESGHVHLAVLPEFVLITDGGEIQLGEIVPTRMLGAKRADRDWLPSALASVLPLEISTELAAAAQVLKAADLDLDPRSIDIYQLGGLLCRLVTGESPEAYRRSPRVKGACPIALRPILERALGCDGSTRFMRAEELCESLRGLSEPASSEPDTSPSVLLSGDRPEDTSVGGSRSSASHSEGDSLPFARLGHYEVVGRIGHGGMGDVYRGYERALDRTVALKVLPTELSREPEFVRRFYAEASAAARVVHPHVIQIHFIGEDAGHHFFAMQYVDGESLASLLVRRGRLSVSETLDILEQTLSGLSAAHRQGLIHRDIKPGNILLDRVHQRALLADFGLVKSLAAVEGHTATGVVMGTVDYIAPEQGRGQPVDHRCDLYAVGVLAYQLLSGRLPFEGDSPTAVIFQHVYERPPSLTDMTADIPPALQAVVAKLLAKSRESRHASAEAVLADLRAIRSGQPLPSQADVELAANSQAFMAASAQPVDRLAQTQIIRAPQFADEPWLPAELPLEPPTWRARVRLWLGDWLRLRTPAWVQQLQSTQQQIDGAVMEYERRRNQLQHLVREAEEVLATLRTALSENGDDTDLRQATSDQEEQLGTMRLRLAQVEVTLQQLRNQRDLLHARLKAAHAKLHLAGKPVVRSSSQRYRIVVTSVLIVSVLMLVVLVAPTVKQRFPGMDSPPLKGPEASPSPNSHGLPLRTELLDSPRLEELGLQTSVHGLACGHESHLIGVVTIGGDIELRDEANGQLLTVIATKARTPQDVAISRDGNHVAAIAPGTLVASSQRLLLWDLRRGDQPTISTDLDGSIRLLGFAGVPLQLMLLRTDGMTKEFVRWPVDSKNQPTRTPCPVDVDGLVTINPTGTRLAVRQRSGAVVLLDFQGQVDVPPSRHAISANATAMVFHPHDGTLAIGAEDGSVTLWDPSVPRPLRQFSGPNSAIVALTFDDAGRRLAVSDGANVRIWDLGLRFVRLVISTSGISSLAFSSKGKQLVVATDARKMQLWDTDFPMLEANFETWIEGLPKDERADFRAKFPLGAPYDQRLAATSDGRLEVAAPINTVPFLKDARTGNTLHHFQNLPSALCVTASPDDRLAAIGGWNQERGLGDIRLFDLKSGRQLGEFVGHAHYVWSMAFSPDATQLLSGGRQTMHLWNVRSREEVHRFNVPFGFVKRVAFSPDGRNAVASESELRIPTKHILFDVATGEALLRFVAMSPNFAFVDSSLLCDQRFGAVRKLEDDRASNNTRN